MNNLFKACDIRGLADAELTNTMVTSISQAVGVKYTGKRVVVGGDFRLSTNRIKKILTEVLADSGCQVIDIGNVATPMFYFALEYCRAEGGIMVTASHNPAEYNGLKLMLGDMPVSEADIKEIAELTAKGASVQGEGKIEKRNIREAYIEHTAEKAARGSLKVVVDAGNGAVSLFAPELYRRCGFEVIELFCEPDGNFPNRPPNPAYPKNLERLAQRVRETGAQLGIAFDGDGDRVGFVDETGRAVENDEILVLISRYYLSKQKGTVVYDAKCSMVVPEQIAAAGGRPLMARAGYGFCKRLFIDEQAVFAGEISGHFFFRELGYDDGMFSGLQMCDIVRQQGALSELIDELPKYILSKESRVPYKGDIPAVLAEVIDNLSSYSLNLTDGVRLEFADGWGMIRASITEPIFTLRFEAKTAERLKEIKQILLAALPEKIRPEFTAAVEAEN